MFQVNLARSKRETVETMKLMLASGPCLAIVSEPAPKFKPINSIKIYRKSGNSRAIIMTNLIEVHSENDLSHDDFTVVSVKHEQQALYIASVYVTPLDRDSLDSAMNRSEVLASNRLIFVGGDFNARHRSWDVKSNPHGNILREFFDRSDFFEWHSPTPTFLRQARSIPDQSTLGQSNIDLCFYNCTLNVSSKFRSYLANSDHAMLEHKIKVNNNAIIKLKMPSRLFRETKDLLEALKSSWQDDEFLDNNLSSIVRTISNKCQTALGLKQPTAKPPRYLELPPEIAQQRNIVMRAKRRLTRCHDPTRRSYLYGLLVESVNRLKTMEDKHEKDSFEALLASGAAFGPPYKIIKSMVSPNAHEEFPRDQLFENLQQLFPGLQPLKPRDDSARSRRMTVANAPGNWTWCKVSPTWIKDRINHTNSNRAPGLDGLTGGILKTLPDRAISLIASAINDCLEHSVFPDSFKTANLVLIPKPGKTDYKSPKNFRPVSLLPIVSKILERVILEHLEVEIGSHLSTHQHGFRAGKSTTTALVSIENWIEDNSGVNKALIAIDFSGAFDRADHAMIVQQLQEWKVAVPLISMIEDYLQDRRIRYGDETFSAGSIGTPQGSVLAPTLWNILINSALKTLSQTTECTAYADDLTICVRAKTINKLTARIDYHINIINSWASAHKLVINSTKSAILPIKCSLGSLETINNLPIVETTKILGLTFSHNHNFNIHINEKLAKARKLRAYWNYLVKSTSILNQASRLMLYTGAIRPMILYGAEVWARKISYQQKVDLRRFERSMLLTALGAYRDTSDLDLHNLARTITIGQYIGLAKQWEPDRDPAVLFNRLRLPGISTAIMPRLRSSVRIFVALSGPDLVGTLKIDTGIIEENYEYKFNPNTDWGRANEHMVGVATRKILASSDYRRSWYIACTTNPFQNKRVTQQWKETLELIVENGIRVFLTGPWNDAPRFTDSPEEVTWTPDMGSRRLSTKNSISTMKAENLSLSQKPEIGRLIRFTNYPYREQVWTATGHGPWPKHLKRRHVGDYECACGTRDVDWRHLCSCPELGPQIKEAEWYLPAYSKAITLRGQKICKSYLYRKTTNAINVPEDEEETEAEETDHEDVDQSSDNLL